MLGAAGGDQLATRPSYGWWEVLATEAKLELLGFLSFKKKKKKAVPNGVGVAAGGARSPFLPTSPRPKEAGLE